MMEKYEMDSQFHKKREAKNPEGNLYEKSGKLRVEQHHKNGTNFLLES